MFFGNCTFFGNEAAGGDSAENRGGGAIYYSSSVRLRVGEMTRLVNCIFQENCDGVGPNSLFGRFKGAASPSFSPIGSLFADAQGEGLSFRENGKVTCFGVDYLIDNIGIGNNFGNFSDDPLFVDSKAGIFYFQPGSPCIGTGWNEEELDFIDDVGAYGPVPDSYSFYDEVLFSGEAEGSWEIIFSNSVNLEDVFVKVWKGRTLKKFYLPPGIKLIYQAPAEWKGIEYCSTGELEVEYSPSSDVYVNPDEPEDDPEEPEEPEEPEDPEKPEVPDGAYTYLLPNCVNNEVVGWGCSVSVFGYSEFWASAYSSDGSLKETQSGTVGQKGAFGIDFPSRYYLEFEESDYVVVFSSNEIGVEYSLEITPWGVSSGTISSAEILTGEVVFF